MEERCHESGSGSTTLFGAPGSGSVIIYTDPAPFINKQMKPPILRLSITYYLIRMRYQNVTDPGHRSVKREQQGKCYRSVSWL
jgi:hypothetical protein